MSLCVFLYSSLSLSPSFSPILVLSLQLPIPSPPLFHLYIVYPVLFMPKNNTCQRIYLTRSRQVHCWYVSPYLATHLDKRISCQDSVVKREGQLKLAHRERTRIIPSISVPKIKPRSQVYEYEFNRGSSDCLIIEQQEGQTCSVFWSLKNIIKEAQ